MTALVDVMRAAAAVNVVLLLVLTGIWVRNYATFRSKHALGLLVFGVLLLLENGLALYFYLFHPRLNRWFAALEAPASEAMTVLRVLETAALLFLVWVTWD